MKHDLTTGTWQDDIGCPISGIILATTSDAHQPEGDTAATIGRIPMDRADLVEDRDFPHDMQDMATTLLETGGWEIICKRDHHTKGRLAAAIGGRDGQISATQRSRC